MDDEEISLLKECYIARLSDHFPGEESDEDNQRLSQLGFDDWCEKPIPLDLFLEDEMVDSCFKRLKSRGELEDMKSLLDGVVESCDVGEDVTLERVLEAQKGLKSIILSIFIHADEREDFRRWVYHNWGMNTMAIDDDEYYRYRLHHDRYQFDDHWFE